jgi:hypothetical protein
VKRKSYSIIWGILVCFLEAGWVSNMIPFYRVSEAVKICYVNGDWVSSELLAYVPEEGFASLPILPDLLCFATD